MSDHDDAMYRRLRQSAQMPPRMDNLHEVLRWAKTEIDRLRAEVARRQAVLDDAHGILDRWEATRVMQVLDKDGEEK